MKDESAATDLLQVLEDFMSYSGLRVLRERTAEFDRLVQKRVSKWEMASVSAYRKRLEQVSFREQEFRILAIDLTIGETYFMRHPQVFASLQKEWEIQLAAGRRDPFHVWSAACSIGCEPYSLAILFERIRAQYPWVTASILASDLNQDFLHTAKQARYGDWSFRSLGPEFRERYFYQKGNEWELQEALRQEVDFFFCNLLQEVPSRLLVLRGKLDALFCRNVLIYFDLETIRTLAERFYDILAPGGWLVLGPSENNWEIFHQFEPVSLNGAVLYRKPDSPRKIHAVQYQPPVKASLPERPREVPVVCDTESEQTVEDIQDACSVKRIHETVRQGKLEEAYDLVRQALVIQDLEPELHMLSGYLCGKTGRESEEDTHYKRALFLDRNYATAQYLHARYGVRTLPTALALRQLRIARTVLEKNPTEPLQLPEHSLTREQALGELQQLEEELAL